MIARALRGEPILVFGDGEQTRCFSAVSDVVRGTLALADLSAAEGEIFNIGTDEEVTVHELARRIKRLCQSESPIRHVEYSEIYGSSFEDMRRRVPDLTKIHRAVGYSPRVSLDQLLETTIRETCEQMGIACPGGLTTA
jgi:UDP-glucose 4-epimerase